MRQGDEEFPAQYAAASSAHRSIPQVLKTLDDRYKAAHFGKWDLRAKITPAELGYDASDGDTGNKNGNISDDKDEKWTQDFITDNPKQIDSITAHAIQFMQTQVKANHPFYLQVSHYATHANFETQKTSFDKFKSKPAGKKHNNPAWAGMIHDLDSSIGELLKMVETLGITDNTYIVLMADNGAVEFIPPVKNRLDPPSTFKVPMRNYPLRGGKWTLYEGGIRVPFIVKGPGVKKGSQSDVPVAGWDLLPTFSELAGNTQALALDTDGGSMVPVLKNNGIGSIKRLSNDFYFHRYNNGYPHSAIIEGDFKLIKFWKTKKVELYNIEKDIGEISDLSAQEAKKAKLLEAKLMQYINEVNPALPKLYKK
ncbi:MAG: sulfatase-like hydrolase/transferase [Spirosomataceae bacterium]